MSPMAKTSGCPGSVQSGFTGTRPAGSVSTPAFWASSFASGEACYAGGPDAGAGAAVRLLRAHHLAVQVDVADVGEQDAGVALLPQGAAQRRGDQPGGQDAGGDLVEQRLEQVVVGPVDHRDVHVGPVEGTRDVQAAEPTADDDHPVAAGTGTRCRVHARLRSQWWADIHVDGRRAHVDRSGDRREQRAGSLRPLPPARLGCGATSWPRRRGGSPRRGRDRRGGSSRRPRARC